MNHIMMVHDEASGHFFCAPARDLLVMLNTSHRIGLAQQPMRARVYRAHPNIRDYWALKCMSRCPDQVVSLNSLPGGAAAYQFLYRSINRQAADMIANLSPLFRCNSIESPLKCKEWLCL
ncbi:hypothetical protein TNCV_2989991 [Trichonephila clavipes]|nr:hypothetical protein TNCV_2989991 [Trichonephila clavipes]